MRVLLPLTLLFSSLSMAEEPITAVPLYTESELIALINKNTHLARVKADDCQLVQDIETTMCGVTQTTTGMTV